MVKLDKEDIIIISVLTVFLVVGWYIIYQNVKNASLGECADIQANSSIRFVKTNCKR